MAADGKRLLLIELKKARLEMEHQDLLETRNALMIAEITIPIAFLTLMNQLGFIANNPMLAVVSILTAVSWALIDSYKADYSAALRRKRSEIEGLIGQIRT